MIGMALAVIITLFHPEIKNFVWVIAGLVGGALVGTVLALRISMTAMPQLVAALHSFVGLSAVLVAAGTYLFHQDSGELTTVALIELAVGSMIGAITFTGSLIAFGKLQGTISGKPLTLPARHWLNLIGVIASIWLGYVFLASTSTDAGLVPLLVMTGIAGLQGMLRDVPVVFASSHHELLEDVERRDDQVDFLERSEERRVGKECRL